MINLLPYEDKKEVEREGLRRFLIVATLSISTILVLGIFLMGPAYFFLYQEKANLDRKEQLSNKDAQNQKLKETIADIKNINSKISIVESSANSPSDSEALKTVVGLIPFSMRIDGLSFERANLTTDKGRARLKGTAATRDGFIAFIKIIEESGLFSKVDSPVSNILNKENIDFSITLTFK